MIHPTAIIHPKAVIGSETKVGAYSVIGENVTLGQGCEIQEHVVITGHTVIGNQVRMFPGVVVGSEPQHLQYRGEPTTTVIGNNVTLRECVTVHRGTPIGINTTIIADNCFIMAYSHVAHDCVIGKNIIIANNVQLAGHVELEDHVIIGGQSAIAQFCRVGRNCYVGGGSILRKDLPPFLVGKGNDFKVQGINQVGLSRQGFSSESLQQLKTLFKIFYMQKLTVNQAIEKISAEVALSEPISHFIQFVKKSKTGFIR